MQVKATDAAGNTDASPASYTWTIQALAPATVTSKTPGDAATEVSVLASPTVTFSRAMDATSLTNSSLTLTPAGGSPVSATVSCDSPCRTATLAPSAQLAIVTTYTVQLTAAAKSSDGIPLASGTSWTFVTRSAPEVKSESPLEEATNVTTGTSTGPKISAVFTRPMDPLTCTTSTYRLWRPNGTQVPATPFYDSATNTMSIMPTLPLAYATTYRVTMEATVKSADGVSMGSQYSWTFTTTSTMVTKRINVGGAAYTSPSGTVWDADQYFKNGLTEIFPTRAISGTSDQALYRDDRGGTTPTALWSYNIPIPNGTYDIRLHFVELTKTGIGQRVFSVDIVDTPGAPRLRRQQPRHLPRGSGRTPPT